jgi:hypothetical protein
MELELTKMENIGKFKPKKKFINFISGISNGVRINSNNATIKGKQLSGTLEGSEFSLKIHEDGSVDFIQTLGDPVDGDMVSRLIDSMSDMNVIGYFGKFVIGELTFTNSEGGLCYLEVEHKTPIQILSLLEESQPKPSDRALSLLDDLLGSSDIEEDKNPSEEPWYEDTYTALLKVVSVTHEVPISHEDDSRGSVTNSLLKESFDKLNEDKVNELKDRIESTQNDIYKTQYDIKSSESKLNNLSDSLGVLKTRLKSMTPGDPFNGWDFSLSEEIKSDIDIDDTVKDVVNKLSPILKLIPEKVMEFLKEGYYVITVSNGEEKPSQDIIEKIIKIDPLGKISRISDFEFRYSGKLTWHLIVDEMIRSGFKNSQIKIDKIEEFNEGKLEDQIINIEGGFGGGGGDDDDYGDDDGDNDEDWIIDPSDALFEVMESDQDTFLNTGLAPLGQVILTVFSKTRDLDNIRSIRHPGFDKIWDNLMENIWETDKMTLEEAKEWCISIGMEESSGLF